MLEDPSHGSGQSSCSYIVSRSLSRDDEVVVVTGGGHVMAAVSGTLGRQYSTPGRLPRRGLAIALSLRASPGPRPTARPSFPLLSTPRLHRRDPSRLQRLTVHPNRGRSKAEDPGARRSRGTGCNPGSFAEKPRGADAKAELGRPAISNFKNLTRGGEVAAARVGINGMRDSVGSGPPACTCVGPSADRGLAAAVKALASRCNALLRFGSRSSWSRSRFARTTNPRSQAHRCPSSSHPLVLAVLLVFAGTGPSTTSQQPWKALRGAPDPAGDGRKEQPRGEWRSSRHSWLGVLSMREVVNQ
ncbi:hypothetical protein B0H15DRAFT_954097 [Mycena belliarum]|uniref:Uncharacterized protein n=1 Tax=Mycena belliarum TaxID=1033014 RepID=A0AAD6TTL3_9AGAR|nr:hypothetical protein B0H15DRAFT_954097 [Mycena belliae]